MMILTRMDMLLIQQTFDLVGYTGYADRFGAFLVDNQGEEEFVLVGRMGLTEVIEKTLNKYRSTIKQGEEV
jgi:hypothetical protein